MEKLSSKRYLVIPRDIVEQLPMTSRGQLIYILAQIRRLMRLQSDPQYYVVSQDEPYAEDVLNTIILGEQRKEKADGKR